MAIYSRPKKTESIFYWDKKIRSWFPIYLFFIFIVIDKIRQAWMSSRSYIWNLDMCHRHTFSELSYKFTCIKNNFNDFIFLDGRNVRKVGLLVMVWLCDWLMCVTCLNLVNMKFNFMNNLQFTCLELEKPALK